MLKRLALKINVALLLFLASFGVSYSATQVTLPAPAATTCVPISKCFTYDAVVPVDGVTGVPYSSSSPQTFDMKRAYAPTANTVYGSITTLNVDQTVLPANATRHGIVVSVTTNSPGAIAFRFDGGAVYDATNSDYAGVYIQPGGTVIFDASMSNTAVTAASPSTGSRYMIVEY
jgi:hypothetical protein